MVDDPHHENEVGQPLVMPRRRGVAGVLISIGLLVAVGAAAAYFGLNYGALFQTVSPTARSAARGEQPTALKDFQSFQQETAASLKSLADDIAAQKADLKSLSEQVTALTATIDALKNAAAPAPQQAAVPARSPVVAARKKPSGLKTTGTSVGGAPLSSAPPPDQ
jgi:uncharacterized protein HemX